MSRSKPHNFKHGHGSARNHELDLRIGPTRGLTIAIGAKRLATPVPTRPALG